jgi:hypothetical protein
MSGMVSTHQQTRPVERKRRFSSTLFRGPLKAQGILFQHHPSGVVALTRVCFHVESKATAKAQRRWHNNTEIRGAILVSQYSSRSPYVGRPTVHFRDHVLVAGARQHLDVRILMRMFAILPFTADQASKTNLQV